MPAAPWRSSASAGRPASCSRWLAPERFTEIAASVTGISARMLTVRLKQLQDAGLVERTVVPTTPVSVRYRLSPRGADLVVALQPIADYVKR